MIKTILIDDEPLATELLTDYLKNESDIQIVGRCQDGYEAVKAIQDLQPDLVFLDIQMPRLNGFEVLELLENPPSVIFCTAFDEYAVNAFEKNAIDYLLKPFSEKRLQQALQKFREPFYAGRQVPEPSQLNQLNKDVPLPNRVVIKNGSKIYVLPYDELIMLEADDDYVKIYTEKGAFMKKKTLAYFDKSLPQDRFVRIHRSYLANVHHIKKIESKEGNTYKATISNGKELPVSRSGYQLLKDKWQIN